MPLEHSASREAVGRNIEREEAAGKPHKQAVAIALNVQREAQDARVPEHWPSEAAADGSYVVPGADWSAP